MVNTPVRVALQAGRLVALCVILVGAISPATWAGVTVTVAPNPVAPSGTLTFTAVVTGGNVAQVQLTAPSGVDFSPNGNMTISGDGTYTKTGTAWSSPGSGSVDVWWWDTGFNNHFHVGLVTFTISAPPPPTAAFTYSPDSGDKPLPVSFTDASTGSPTSWAWNFGDGSTATTQNASHTYNSYGTFTVVLTATNAQGSNAVSHTVTVAAVPPSPPNYGAPASAASVYLAQILAAVLSIVAVGAAIWYGVVLFRRWSRRAYGG